MSAIPWQLLNTFALPLALYALPRAFAFYRSLRNPSLKSSVKSLDSKTSYTLNLLFIFAILSLGLTLPIISPSNIFTDVPNARPATPTNALFERLSTLRPLTDGDEMLRSLLSSKSGRLLYYAVGPVLAATCPFCSPSELDVPGVATIPFSYLMYALPSVVLPHLVHLALLGAVTSSLLTRIGARFRTQALLAGAAIMTVDMYTLATYDVKMNSRANSLNEIDFFHWRLRTYRYLGIAGVDAILGLVIWAAGTNRFFMKPPGISERLEALGNVTEASNARLWAAGVVNNTVCRSEELVMAEGIYWREERSIWEEREVVHAVNGALQRMDMRRLEGAAEERARTVVLNLQVPQMVSAG